MAKRLVRAIKYSAKGFLSVCRNVKILCNGQTQSDSILQLAHRLEKGLTIREPRPFWGWDKAEQLSLLLENEKRNPECFAYETGASVLYAYLAAKKACGNIEEVNRADAMLHSLDERGIHLVNSEWGGAAQIDLEDILLSAEEYSTVEKLFSTRHSVRDYADNDVGEEIILKAVKLANRCPSACNRQPFHVYVVDAADKKKAGFKNEMHANKYLLITGHISSFSINEMNDWIVSASIFAGYLCLALHAYGVGSCIMRKDLVNETGYNTKMRDFCRIPKDEQIVLELAVGHYKDSFRAPVSNRIPAEKLVTFINAD